MKKKTILCLGRWQSKNGLLMTAYMQMNLNFYLFKTMMKNNSSYCENDGYAIVQFQARISLSCRISTLHEIIVFNTPFTFYHYNRLEIPRITSLSLFVRLFIYSEKAFFCHPFISITNVFKSIAYCSYDKNFRNLER